MALHILAGDIGGTHSRLIYIEIGDGGQNIVAEKDYSSAHYSDFYQVLNDFIAEYSIDVSIDAACFAVAGPVDSGVAKVTNLPWQISEQQLTQELKTTRVKLINDFVAAAYGITGLADADKLILQQGQKNIVSENHDAAVIGAGTGLGAAHIVWMKDHYRVYSSEEGHVGFAPENAMQCELLSWMQKKHSHVSLEMLLSGTGLSRIYKFLLETSGLSESAAVHEAMLKNDPAQVIAEQALLNNDNLCEKALDVFIDVYGAAASNVALHYYPITKLYITGGIAPKIKDKLVEKRFINAFLNKGLMSSNMKKINLILILQDRVGLYGALSTAQMLVEK